MNRIYRSREDRVLGGVAAGMAEYLNLDVVLVRLLWVLALFAGGVGIGVYIVAWIIIPEEPYPGAIVNGRRDSAKIIVDENVNDGREIAAGEDEIGSNPTPEDGAARDRTHQALGVLLVILGFAFLIKETVHMDVLRYLWPVLLVLLGIYIIINDKRGS